jgi:hypothetical protein
MVNWKNKYLEMKLKYINAKHKDGKTTSLLTSKKKGGIRSKFYAVTQIIKQLINRFAIGGWDYVFVPGLITLHHLEHHNFNEEHTPILINSMLTDFSINPVIGEILSDNNYDMEESFNHLLDAIAMIDVNANPPTYEYTTKEGINKQGQFPWWDDGMNLISQILN